MESVAGSVDLNVKATFESGQRLSEIWPLELNLDAALSNAAKRSRVSDSVCDCSGERAIIDA